MEDVRCLVLVAGEGVWRCEDVQGNTVPLPEGVTPRHVAALMALYRRGNAVPLLSVLPRHILPGIDCEGSDTLL